MSRIFVVPAEGLTITDPATRKPLPNGGAWVDACVYWTRRLNDQDVTDDTAAQTARESAAPATIRTKKTEESAS